MSKYFSDCEFACHHCGQLPANGMDPNLLIVLDTIREIIGKPITVNSGYRCEYWNHEVGGVLNSQHVLGIAADLTYDGIDVDYLADVAERALNFYGFEGGVGKYWSQGFVHVDTRGYTARWTEND